MTEIRIRCFWCKQLLGPVRLNERCRCIGYGRRRFHARVWLARLVKRLQRCAS